MFQTFGVRPRPQLNSLASESIASRSISCRRRSYSPTPNVLAPELVLLIGNRLLLRIWLRLRSAGRLAGKCGVGLRYRDDDSGKVVSQPL